MRKVKVSVTQEQIKWGKQGEPESCPVALAICTKLHEIGGIPGKPYCTVSVTGSIFYISCKEKPEDVKMVIEQEINPRVAQKIARYDKYGTMAPFDFYLLLP